MIEVGEKVRTNYRNRIDDAVITLTILLTPDINTSRVSAMAT